MGDRVDKWLENALRPTEEDSGRQDMQLAILKERMRMRRRARKNWRLRGGAVVLSLAVLGVFFGGVVDLGGDSFDLVEHESAELAEQGTKVVRNEFRGIGIGGPKDLTDEEFQELNQQFASGEGKIIGVTGFEIEGKPYWSLSVERVIGNEVQSTAQPPRDVPSKLMQSHMEFVSTEWTLVEPDIESGALPPSGRRTMRFDGISFAVDYWIIDSENFGEVTYSQGTPIR